MGGGQTASRVSTGQLSDTSSTVVSQTTNMYKEKEPNKKESLYARMAEAPGVVAQRGRTSGCIFILAWRILRFFRQTGSDGGESTISCGHDPSSHGLLLGFLSHAAEVKVNGQLSFLEWKTIRKLHPQHFTVECSYYVVGNSRLYWYILYVKGWTNDVPCWGSRVSVYNN